MIDGFRRRSDHDHGDLEGVGAASTDTLLREA